MDISQPIPQTTSESFQGPSESLATSYRFDDSRFNTTYTPNKDTPTRISATIKHDSLSSLQAFVAAGSVGATADNNLSVTNYWGGASSILWNGTVTSNPAGFAADVVHDFILEWGTANPKFTIRGQSAAALVGAATNSLEPLSIGGGTTGRGADDVYAPAKGLIENIKIWEFESGDWVLKRHYPIAREDVVSTNSLRELVQGDHATLSSTSVIGTQVPSQNISYVLPTPAVKGYDTRTQTPPYGYVYPGPAAYSGDGVSLSGNSLRYGSAHFRDPSFGAGTVFLSCTPTGSLAIYFLATQQGLPLLTQRGVAH